MRRALLIARTTMRQRARGNVVFLVLVQPLIFCAVWGFCVSLELREARVAILDRGDPAAARARVRALEGTGVFRATVRARTLADVEHALASGAAGLAVVVTRRETTVVADGTDATLATIGLSDALGALRDAGGPRVPVRVWYRPSLESSHLLLLGALCYNLVWILSYPAASLMDDRRRGALAALARTPLRARELWLGTTLPYLVLALWGALSQVGLAVGLAGVPLRGDPALLAGCLALFALIHANLGFMVAALARTGAQRTLAQLVLVFLMLAVAGFLVPDLELPPWLRAVAEAVPLHHGLRLVRALFLRGASAADVAHELRALTAFALASTVAALVAARALLGGTAGRPGACP